MFLISLKLIHLLQDVINTNDWWWWHDNSDNSFMQKSLSVFWFLLRHCWSFAVWHSETKATHSDTVDLLQWGIQRQKPLIQVRYCVNFCSVAFRDKSHSFRLCVNFCSVAFRDKSHSFRHCVNFCSVAFREKSHSFRHCWSFAVWHSERKTTHSDTVDLLQCGIQRERLHCRQAFRRFWTHSARRSHQSWSWIPAPTPPSWLSHNKTDPKGLAAKSPPANHHPPGKAFSYPTR